MADWPVPSGGGLCCFPKRKAQETVKISLTSIHVNDQDEALRFYTEVLGFVKKHDFPVGEFKWLTVVSPEGPDDIELLLEPNDNPVARSYQEGIFEQAIPHAAFAVQDIHEEYERLKKLGVVFTMEPTPAGPVIQAVLNDTCGNLILLYQE